MCQHLESGENYQQNVTILEKDTRSLKKKQFLRMESKALNHGLKDPPTSGPFLPP